MKALIDFPVAIPLLVSMTFGSACGKKEEAASSPSAQASASPTVDSSTAAIPTAIARPAAATEETTAVKLPTRAKPEGRVSLPAKLGAVTFDHAKHADEMKVACTRCHHPSRQEKPLLAEQQSCRQCHTTPATEPVKTGLQAAFHNPRATSGTCIDCHRDAVAAGKAAPLKCTDCHKKQ